MTDTEKDLRDALISLQREIRAHHKMNVKKDFALMVADAQASKAIADANLNAETTQ